MKFTIAGIEIELFFQAWSFLSFFSGVHVVPYSLTRAGGDFFQVIWEVFQEKEKKEGRKGKDKEKEEKMRKVGKRI